MMLTKHNQKGIHWNVYPYVFWQRYAERNALRWLEIEGRFTRYKKMDAFMQINVERFGDHETLVALGPLATKSFMHLHYMFTYQL